VRRAIIMGKQERVSDVDDSDTDDDTCGFVYQLRILNVDGGQMINNVRISAPGPRWSRPRWRVRGAASARRCRLFWACPMFAFSTRPTTSGVLRCSQRRSNRRRVW